MADISSKIIDLYDDLEFSGIVKIASLPEEIKKMEVLPQSKLDAMHDESFGLICFNKYAHKVRRYPIHDREHTWLSAQYFDKTASALPENLRKMSAMRIKTACQRFDIDKYPKSLDGVLEKKAQRTDIKYAVRNEFPIETQVQVKLAAGYFNKYASQLSDPKDRNVFATNVTKRAEELGINIQQNHKETLEKYASSKYNESVNLFIEQRKNMLPGKDKEISFLEKLAQSTKTEKPQDVADTLYLFDKKAGLSKHWDSKLKDPFASVFGVTKTASYTFDIGEGDMTDKDVMKVLNGTKIKSYLGEHLTKTAKSNVIGVFESLPEPHQEIIYNIHRGIL